MLYANAPRQLPSTHLSTPERPATAGAPPGVLPVLPSAMAASAKAPRLGKTMGKYQVILKISGSFLKYIGNPCGNVEYTGKLWEI